MTRLPLAALAALFAATLGACSGGGSEAPPVAVTPPPPQPPAPAPPLPPPTSTERQVNPALTNTALIANLSPHFAINPATTATPAGRLFVMLPGTGANPRAYEDVVRAGAARGYHALGLTYPNDEAIGSLCQGSSDPDCEGRARREVITGENASVLVNVDAANAIDGRLRALLAYLSATFPAEGWGQYLVNGQVDWTRITVAGHSQGAGHAGYLAKLRDLNRVVMFSGPGDNGLPAAVPAQWLSLPNVTPSARQFGFVHTADPLTTLAQVTRNWDVTGLDEFGPPVSVDGASPPYQGSHQLVTTAPPNPDPTGQTASPPHGAPVADSVTPRAANNVPVFLPVWTYLAFP